MKRMGTVKNRLGNKENRRKMRNKKIKPKKIEGKGKKTIENFERNKEKLKTR